MEIDSKICCCEMQGDTASTKLQINLYAHKSAMESTIKRGAHRGDVVHDCSASAGAAQAQTPGRGQGQLPVPALTIVSTDADYRAQLHQVHVRHGLRVCA